MIIYIKKNDNMITWKKKLFKILIAIIYTKIIKIPGDSEYQTISNIKFF